MIVKKQKSSEGFSCSCRGVGTAVERERSFARAENLFAAQNLIFCRKRIRFCGLLKKPKKA